MAKLPRLAVNWPLQPEMMRRYWDQAMTAIEAAGSGGGTGTVTSVSLSVPSGFVSGGSPVTSSGTLTIAYDTGYQGYTTAESIKLAGIAPGATANTGTVTSVAATVPTGFNIAGSPITTSGTLAITYDAGYQGYTTAESTKLAGIASGAQPGTVTSVAASGGTTGLTFSGSPITTSGTLTLGGTLAEVNGGTGQSTYAVGDILYASTTTALSRLADVAVGNALLSGGVGVAPAWGKVGLTTHVTGTLPVSNGGTGATTITTNFLVKGNGTSPFTASIINDNGTEVGIGAAALTAFRLFVQGTDSTISNYSILLRNSSSTNLFFVHNDGSFNTGSATGSPYNATTASAANVVVTSSGYLQRSTSSARYKTDIETIESSYADAALKLRPVFYRSTSKNDNPNWSWWGLIAEEVAEIDPRLVHYNDKGEPDGVQYERLAVLLLDIVKRQEQRITELENKDT